MRPGARVQAAIEVLEAWQARRRPVERVLADWGRAHRFAGSGDRHAIADHVYATLRAARSLQILGGGGDPGDGLAAFAPRPAVLAALAMAGIPPGSLADGGRHAPAPPEGAERAALEALPEAAAARLAAGAPGARFDLPDCVAAAALDSLPAIAAALRERAPVHLRVNTLRATPAEAIALLAEDGVTARPGPLSPTALEVEAGARRVAAGRAFREGAVDLQDAASQAAVDLAGAAPGMTVLDLCAGGGGKTLALGAAMAGEGRLLAHDAAPGRMADLPARAARAGLAVERVDTPGLDALAGRVDLVFVDAPCSGSGSWRRDPAGKWRLDADRLATLAATQDALLDRAFGLVAPGGRVVFAVCSFLPGEGPERLAALAGRRPGLAGPVAAAARLESRPTPGGADGFFAARIDTAGGDASPFL